MLDKKKEEQAEEKKPTEKKREKAPVDILGSIMDKLKQFGLSKLVFVLVAGILLLLLVSEMLNTTNKQVSTSKITSHKSNQKVQNNTTTEEYIYDLENRLKQVLKKVENIGDVEVMITVKSSKESVVLKDENSQEETTEEQDSAGGSRKSNSKSSQDETGLQQSESGGTLPYIVKELEPEIAGVLVIAEGGNNEVVKSDVIAAVQVLFDVPAHKIKVMKMNH